MTKRRPKTDGRLCVVCGIEKTEKNAYKNPNHKSGFDSYCKDHRNQYQQARKERMGPDFNKSRVLKYRTNAEYRERAKAYTRAWIQKVKAEEARCAAETEKTPA